MVAHTHTHTHTQTHAYLVFDNEFAPRAIVVIHRPHTNTRAPFLIFDTEPAPRAIVPDQLRTQQFEDGAVRWYDLILEGP
jgi:hypothetical protein